MNNAVIKGPIAIVTRTLATVVSVIASMKAVNITDQQRPENQSGQDACANPRQSAGPRMASRATLSARALNRLRQKVTSKLPALSR